MSSNAREHVHDSARHDHAGHDHDHDHASHHTHRHGPGGHSHSHAPREFNRAFAIGAALNLAFVVAEVVWGLSAHSLALLSDAGHNLSDVMGLLLAWGALRLSQSEPTARYTYGLRRSSILAALVNAGMLLFVTGAITWEAIRRLEHPSAVVAGTVMWVAALGIAVNGSSALLFLGGREKDINVRGAFAHLAADALIAAGVVVAGGVMRVTGWHWIDPVVSIAIGVLVALATWGIFRESMNLSMDAVPEHIDPAEVERYLASIPGVRAVHDLHIWAMSTTETALTVHLVAPDCRLGDHGLTQTANELRRRFRIGHSTIQIEDGDPAHECEQSSPTRV